MLQMVADSSCRPDFNSTVTDITKMTTTEERLAMAHMQRT